MHIEAPNRTSLIINRFKRKASQQILNKQERNVLHERVNAFCSDQFPGDENQGEWTLSLCIARMAKEKNIEKDGQDEKLE